MKNLLISIVVVVLVTIFEHQYDDILIWLYDNGGFWSGLVRVLIVTSLLSALGVFDASQKARMGKGDT